MNAVAWTLAAVVMFGPGAAVTLAWRRNRRRHLALRARVAGYTLAGRWGAR